MLNISGEDIIHQNKLSCQIPSIVEAIAKRKIIASVAKEVGVEVEEEELQEEGDRLRMANKLVKATDTWAWLKKHHLSLDDFEELARHNILAQKLPNHLFSHQVEPFFFEHQTNYVQAVTYEIILDDYDLALELFYSLQESEASFPQIARQHILDPELRRTWGYQGVRNRQDFLPEITAVIFAANPPEILKPIVTAKGVHLILVEEIIQPKLDEKLRQKIITDLFEAWLKQQIETAQTTIQLDLEAKSIQFEEMLKQA
ncbi:peptidylprolyl isomerase [Iningainema tapete]|uniref:peptidylprolyl isomerase n=1 Tax=Iningainema tapete BLCC-T55 TaxID=2748662 RepID=A0A8J6XTM5_9CYAN|nr:peptidylprolyl isomerase [Iningainema tapete]MBD2773638.1 peptidylprolyl isomerase [Iningainema tapete BLCC-T55]